MRHMLTARQCSRNKVQVICSLSDMTRNTYYVVYDIVYDITYCISYTTLYAYTTRMSYTMCNILYRILCHIRYRMRYPLIPPLRFIQQILLHRLRAGASGFQLPCVLTPKHASASSPLHLPLRSSISRGGALAQCRGFGTCGSKGVGTPDRRPTCSWDPPLQRHGPP